MRENRKVVRVYCRLYFFIFLYFYIFIFFIVYAVYQAGKGNNSNYPMEGQFRPDPLDTSVYEQVQHANTHLNKKCNWRGERKSHLRYRKGLFSKCFQFIFLYIHKGEIQPYYHALPFSDNYWSFHYYCCFHPRTQAKCIALPIWMFSWHSCLTERTLSVMSPVLIIKRGHSVHYKPHYHLSIL